eukprot:COSAG02_NODE_44225_length_368_cov_0.579926_2_plen_84_part_01
MTIIVTHCRLTDRTTLCTLVEARSDRVSTTNRLCSHHAQAAHAYERALSSLGPEPSAARTELVQGLAKAAAGKGRRLSSSVSEG